ncbi:MAG TPA: hypothetical protein VF092_03260 [Longimicrobium sp.]
MFGSTIIDVAIGLIMVYLLMSLLCSAIREGIESFMKTRASDLERGIRELLHERESPGLVEAVYKHPLISSLYHGDYKLQTGGKDAGQVHKDVKLPSYIPAANFALALMDVAARGKATDASSASADSTRLSLDSMRAGIANIGNIYVQRALLTALDTANGELAAAQKNVEAWFNGSMDRVSGWYKRRTQSILFFVGLGVTVVMNVNSIGIATALIRSPALRDAVVAQAQTLAADTALAQRLAADTSRTADSLVTTNIRRQVAAINSLDLPIGWAEGMRGPIEGRSGVAWWDWASPILGWLLTAFAVTLGAPFWFDVLNKFIVVRSTVKPHEKSPEEGSEDRQPRGGGTPPPHLGAVRDQGQPPQPQPPQPPQPQPPPPPQGDAG